MHRAPTQPALRVGEHTNTSSAPPSIYTGYPTLDTFPAQSYLATFSSQQYPWPPLPPPAMYPQDMPAVGPYSSPHFFPRTPMARTPAPATPLRCLWSAYSHPAHLFHAPCEPPSVSPITSTSVGAPVLPAGSSRGELRTCGGGVHGKVREHGSNKDRHKGKDIDRAQPLERQPYHPTPPVSRSDWVMWVGNVPRDAGHDELWRFFTEGPEFRCARPWHPFHFSSSPAPRARSSTTRRLQPSRPPLRSSTAFRLGRVAHLNAGNGTVMTTCVRAWVGNAASEARVAGRRIWRPLQIGHGHGNGQERVDIGGLGLAQPGWRARLGVNELEYAGTTFSAAVLHFEEFDEGELFVFVFLSYCSSLSPLPYPHSPTVSSQEDLDLSVRTGVWATQRHNESVLDRAFRTAADVVLIFSVNKSGEFYGWARCVYFVFSVFSSLLLPRTQPILTSVFPIHRMEGPVGQGEAAPWAPRGDQADPALTAETHTHTHRPPPTGPARAVQSAPALVAMRSSARLSVLRVPKPKRSLDPMMLRELEHPLAASPGTEKEVRASADTRNREGGGQQEGTGEGWGQSFAVRWMCTESLPFTRTKSVRNPWNHDRQVKIARDGTEIEPAVGHALIEQWSGSGADGMLQGLKLG
ncbi:YTH domain-containing protein 1 [Mycena venus]|uniref:YTH domain-containing protein 1 n=1 Tax=Mycena venus TaxID=2733690 RepID=A0A8H6Z7N0_9AGAR|nr:YTH domain-containing protein 1 [Mycena venus]